MWRTIAAAAAVLASAASASAAISTAEAKRVQAAARTVQEIRAEIPEEYWTRARCVGVIPDLKKAAFIFGGEFGRGVMSCRAGDQWSAPVFVELAKGSWGFQAGVEQVDLVLLVMNERGVQRLLQNKTTLGADASVSAGPVGRRSAVATDAQLSAEILSYSRSQGLFAGIDLSGGVLRPDEDSNADVYGTGAEPRTILASRELSAPPEAREFLRALGAASSPSAPEPPNRPLTSSAAATPPAPRTTTMSTTDDDLRARVVDIQQSLDRILADTTPTAAGTTGTTGSATTTDTAAGSGSAVTVDRARLIQLRRQIDALLASLNRR
jgi:lipid-binding SYLF domain-containing protein